MKKSIIVIVAGIFLVIIAFLLFSSSPEESNVTDTKKTPETEHATPPEEDTSDDSDVPDDSSDDNDDEPVELPEATPKDITKAVFESGSDAEEKFLTKDQKEELNSASITKKTEVIRPEQKYKISWKSTSFDSKLPELPEEAPVYLLDRPEEGGVFGTIKQLAKDLLLKGAVIRMSTQTYAVANIATGEYFLTYDLYHLFFEATDLKVLLDESEDPVTESMQKWGLLSFPFTVETKEDRAGETWYEYSPALDLPVVSMEQEDVSSGYTPGRFGKVSVQSDGDYLTGILSRFPNIKEKDTVSLSEGKSLKKTLESGEFQLGKVELQYPGAVSLEEKRSFYDITKRKRISIENAELSRLECGYLLENEESLQALMSPVCIAHGRGKVKQNSVFFQVVLPAVE